jgi:hypothetical protein
MMGILKPDADETFIRTLHREHMFGGVHGSTRAPYLILKSTNFDVAFAGMLSWERAMSANLAPLFGEPVLKTLVPLREASSTPARFVDALRANRSIRILYDELGNERIVYAFVNKELIVITTSWEALATLIERINKK